MSTRVSVRTVLAVRRPPRETRKIVSATADAASWTIATKSISTPAKPGCATADRVRGPRATGNDSASSRGKPRGIPAGNRPRRAYGNVARQVLVEPEHPAARRNDARRQTQRAGPARAPRRPSGWRRASARLAGPSRERLPLARLRPYAPPSVRPSRENRCRRRRPRAIRHASRRSPGKASTGRDQKSPPSRRVGENGRREPEPHASSTGLGERTKAVPPRRHIPRGNGYELARKMFAAQLATPAPHIVRGNRCGASVAARSDTHRNRDVAPERRVLGERLVVTAASLDGPCLKGLSEFRRRSARALAVTAGRRRVDDFRRNRPRLGPLFRRRWGRDVVELRIGRRGARRSDPRACQRSGPARVARAIALPDDRDDAEDQHDGNNRVLRVAARNRNASGRTARGRTHLLGGLNRKEAHVYVRARRAEYSGFVECKGRVAVSARFAAKEASYIGGRGAPCVLEHHPSSIRHRAGEGEVGERFRGYTGVDHGPGRSANTRSNGPSTATRRTTRATSPWIQRATRPHPRDSTFARSTWMASGERSTSKARSAPRERASIASAPVPAYRIEHASPREDPRRRKNPEERLPDDDPTSAGSRARAAHAVSATDRSRR